MTKEEINAGAYKLLKMEGKEVKLGTTRDIAEVREAQVAKADHLMYQSKQKYYQKKENDRRKSSDNF